MSQRLVLLFAALFAYFAIAIPARADTQFGVQTFTLTGTHFEPNADSSGTGAGGFIRIDERWRSVQVHVEGLPSVGTATVDTSAGPIKATLGMFAASARFRIDRFGRLWAGIGTEILAQQTPQFTKVFASRLAGTRYEVISVLPISAKHFVETQVAVMPHLSGVAHETRTLPNTVPQYFSGAETASMIDASTSLGTRSGGFDYLIGVHMLNFAAKFVDGREADRNVGAGLMAEVRAHF
jgi:hypothetical protein